jgi:hypothetical protein
MITCNFLGELGNNLFQTATLIGLSSQYNIPFQLINNRNCYVSIKDRPLELIEMFDYPFQYYEGTTISFIHYKSPDTQGIFEHTSINLDFSQNIVIEGYFQSEKYFKTVKEDIINYYFKLKETHIDYINNKYKFIINQNNLSIHIRVGGDRASLQHSHKNVSLDYYKTAINIALEKDPTIENYIVFSDNISYCKEIFGNDKNIIYIENEKNYIDLFLMSLCKHNIIANSTFSWWAAYLNKNSNKTIIAPKSEWFGPTLKHLNLQDLFPQNWITL